MTDEADADQALLSRIRAGDQHALGEFFGAHRERLRRMVQLRLDRRLQGRIDPDDVLQEAFVDAARRLAEYAADPAMPPFLWLRFLTMQRLQTLHRLHLGVKSREAGREVSLYNGSLPGGRLPVAGRPAPRPVDDAEPGRDPGRDPDQDPGGAQRHGPDRPRDPGPAALRGAQQRRDGRRAGHPQGRGQQPLRPGLAPAQGDPSPALGLIDDSGSPRRASRSGLPAASESCRARSDRLNSRRARDEP